MQYWIGLLLCERKLEYLVLLKVLIYSLDFEIRCEPMYGSSGLYANLDEDENATNDAASNQAAFDGSNRDHYF